MKRGILASAGTAVLLTLAAAVTARAAAAATAELPPVRCLGQPDKATAVAPAAGRKVYCAIDLGSNSAKLQVLSMEPDRPLSFRGERQCRARLGFGAVVFDSATKTARPLPPSDIEKLIGVMKELQGICALDKGTMVGVEATQWARDATNMGEVKAAVKAGTGLDVDVLTPEQEGHYGYVAATHDRPGRLALDPGSNSFQISWWPKGADAARSVSIPFGYVRAGKAFYDAASEDSYEAARARHAAQVRTQIEEALAVAAPAKTLSDLKTAIAKGEIRPELFIFGQDGALHLVVRGRLRDPEGRWVDSASAYDALMTAEPTTNDPDLGEITTVLTPAELTGFFERMTKPADYKALLTDPARGLYGERTLANAALLDLLIRELALEKVILVPQEMPSGYILSKIR